MRQSLRQPFGSPLITAVLIYDCAKAHPYTMNATGGSSNVARIGVSPSSKLCQYAPAGECIHETTTCSVTAPRSSYGSCMFVSPATPLPHIHDATTRRSNIFCAFVMVVRAPHHTPPRVLGAWADTTP